MLALALLPSAFAVTEGLPTDEPAAVIHFMASLANGSYTTCSAVLVGPTTAVTLAECVQDWDGVPAQPDGITLWSASSIFDDPLDLGVAELHVHPYLEPGFDSIGSRFNIARLTLEAPVPGVEPLALPAALDEESLLGDEVRLVGFGATCAMGCGSGTERNEGLATIVDHPVGFLETEGQNSGWGDGGGAVLDADGQLVALMAYGTFNDTNVLISSRHIRLDAHAPWIDDPESLDSLPEPEPEPPAQVGVDPVTASEGGCQTVAAPWTSGALLGGLLLGARRRLSM